MKIVERPVGDVGRRVEHVPFGLGRPIWVDDPVFDIARHVHADRGTPLGVAVQAEPSGPYGFAVCCACQGLVQIGQVPLAQSLLERADAACVPAAAFPLDIRDTRRYCHSPSQDRAPVPASTAARHPASRPGP